MSPVFGQLCFLYEEGRAGSRAVPRQPEEGPSWHIHSRCFVRSGDRLRPRPYCDLLTMKYQQHSGAHLRHGYPVEQMFHRRDHHMCQINSRTKFQPTLPAK